MAVIAPTGFREYDARWRWGAEIDAAGMRGVGRAIATQLARRGGGRRVVVGHDWRSYSETVKAALADGLAAGGAHVLDIGMSLTPMAYFAWGHLGADAVAMVTASHNPNGWTGVKLGFDHPLTHGPEAMAELRDITLNRQGRAAPGGRVETVPGMRAAYLDELARDTWLDSRPHVVCATGNGTAGDFAPELLDRIGARVSGLHTRLDHDFPHYNPNPEALEMLRDMGRAVRAAGADLGLGFDGDGDRVGVVDETGEEIFADKIGLLIARDLAPRHPGAGFVVDVKSTGLFATDPVLAAHRAGVEYWKTGHSHMKARLSETGALAGFERSGHFFFAPPLGRGYDCALTAAVAICRMLDRAPGAPLSARAAALPATWTTPTLDPQCPDQQKYQAVARLTARLQAMAQLAGRRIARIVTVNGARVMLEGGSWALVRASSNTPNLVVICESTESAGHLRRLYDEFNALVQEEPAVGPATETF